MSTDQLVPPTPEQPGNLPISPPTNYTARFEIYTNGTRRIFTNPMYHQRSADIYIEAADPHLIQIKKPGTTWNDFFKTLPFSLEKDCLITGTNQTFCNTDTKKLFFYLNGNEVPDALDKVIAPNDQLRVEYKSVNSREWFGLAIVTNSKQIFLKNEKRTYLQT